MKMFVSLFAIWLAGRLLYAQAPAPQREWRMTLKVVDQDGNPVSGATVGVGFYIHGQPASIDGLTDTNGIFIATRGVETSVLGYNLGFGAKKQGYYPVNEQQLLSPMYDYGTWNQTIVLGLKKMKDPIAMYAKLVSSEPEIFKKTGRPPISFTNTVGYDFTAGDWVVPFGKGSHSDIFLKEEFNKKSFKDIYWKLVVTFPNAGDGVQPFKPTEADKANANGSGLLSAYEAPTDGYMPTFVESQTSDPQQNLYFRVRTILDANGNVKSALYGKIYGDFTNFRYYLNPTPNDRNVEFDPGHNLIGGLKSFEQVRSP